MDFVDIDGSFGEGGGQIVRTSMSLAAILGKPIRITRIRAGRKEPGLRPQHLQAVTSSAQICNGKLDGAGVGSSTIEFVPGKPDRSFSAKIDTGTAGSITLIAQTLIPISIFRKIDLDVEIIGGTEVPFSPTIDYLEKIVFPIYRKIGADISMETKQRGYYPKGGGVVRIRCSSKQIELRGLELTDFSKAGQEPIQILSISRNLPEHVSQRQVDAAKSKLSSAGLTNIVSKLDTSGQALSPGTSVLVYQVSERHLIGATALGARGKRAEEVGNEAAGKFLNEIELSPAVDSHLADMLATLAPCIPGRSVFTTPEMTKHLITNIEIAQKLTGRLFESIRTKEEGVWSIAISSISEKSN